MAPLPIEFHPQAIAEARHAREWYADHGAELGDAFMRELDRALDQIAASPHRWAHALHGTRQYLMHRFPYLIIYQTRAEAIVVVAVAHAKQKPGYWTARATEPGSSGD